MIPFPAHAKKSLPNSIRIIRNNTVAFIRNHGYNIPEKQNRKKFRNKGGSSMSLLTVEKVTHGFGARQILEDASFRLLKGEHIGLIGANGEGKSTFLNFNFPLIG